MKSTLVFCLAAALLLSTVHRAPAPISEESPTPAPEQSAKQKPKRTVESKSSEGSERQTKKASPTPAVQKDPFDGTWTGTYIRGWMGETQHTYLISGHGTLLRETIGTSNPHVWNATCDGTTMRWSWVGNVQGNSTFTPSRDGRTAVFTVKATGIIGGYETSTIFHKISP